MAPSAVASFNSTANLVNGSNDKAQVSKPTKMSLF